MDASSLPLVPFGKYKHKPVTALLADYNYLTWCKKQEWFKKYTLIHNICVHQTITAASSEHSKPPEHNQMQNLFLDTNNVSKLIVEMEGSERCTRAFCRDVEFDGMFNWDVILPDLSYNACTCDLTLDKTTTCTCGGRIVRSLPDVYLRITPCLGNDYPAVLRKMKLQIALTDNATRFTCENNIFVLLVKHFKCVSATKEQLVDIFLQSRVRVLFLNDVFDDLSTLQPVVDAKCGSKRQLSECSDAEKKPRASTNRRNTILHYFGK